MKTINTKHEFSEIEKRHLLKAWIMLSLAFAILLNGGDVFNSSIIFSFIVASLTVGVAFLFHEIGHKILAQRYGCWAEFRADTFMLLIGIIMAFFGFILVIPGGVFIQGTITTKRNGIISMMGPLINLVLGGLFFALKFVFEKESIGALIAEYGLFINAWLAIFNMIPLFNIDGQKIWRWNKFVYSIMLVAGICLFLGYYYL